MNFQLSTGLPNKAATPELPGIEGSFLSTFNCELSTAFPPNSFVSLLTQIPGGVPLRFPSAATSGVTLTFDRFSQIAKSPNRYRLSYLSTQYRPADIFHFPLHWSPVAGHFVFTSHKLRITHHMHCRRADISRFTARRPLPFWLGITNMAAHNMGTIAELARGPRWSSRLRCTTE